MVGGGGRSGGRQVLARAFARKEEGEEGRADLSPALFFHLTATQMPPSLHPTCRVRVRPYLPPLSSSSPSPLPPAVASIVLARVSSPSSSPFTHYDGAITRFFSQRRVLSPQQVIGLPLTPNPSFLTADYNPAKDSALESHEAEVEDADDEEAPSDPLQSPHPLVFYRITSPSPSPYLVVEPGVTAISTEGSVNAPCPYSLSSYLQRTPLDPLSSLLLSQPPLSVHLQALHSLVLPSLSPTSTSLSVLVQAPAQSLMPQVMQALAASLGWHYYPLSLYAVMSAPSPPASSPPTPTSTVPYAGILSSITACAPCLVHLLHVSSLSKMPSHMPSPLPFLRLLLSSHLTLADTPTYDAAPPSLTSLFTHQYDATSFTREERTSTVDTALTWVGGIADDDRKEMARIIGEKTAGLSVGELVGVVKEGVRLGRRRWMEEEEKRRSALQQRMRLSAAPSSSVPSPFILAPFTLTLPDVLSSLSTLTTRTASQAGTLTSTPTTRWSDIGGLESAKREINDIIHLPLLHPALFSSPNSTAPPKRRGGLLLYGPPGGGKTLLAKAVACESGLNFISVKGPELLNMYVGESERNVREVFHRARAARPCVVFFDELDSLAPRRGGGSDGGGVMDRVVSQLLTEMDSLTAGTTPSDSIFIIGATNRPDLLDSALLRPGRLDRQVYLGVGEGVEGRVAVLKALTRKLKLEGGGSWLKEVGEGMEGRGFTGADCYGLVMDALMEGVKRRIEEVRMRVEELNALQRQLYADTRKEGRRNEEGDDEEEEHLGEEEEGGEVTALSYLRSLKEEELEVEVTREHFLHALQHLTPSLSKEELDHYETLRLRFSKGRPSAVTSQGTEEAKPVDGAGKPDDGERGRVLAAGESTTSKEEREERKEGGGVTRGSNSLPHTPHLNGADRSERRSNKRRGR